MKTVKPFDQPFVAASPPTTDGKQPLATGRKANRLVTLLKAAHEDSRSRGSGPFHLKTVRQIRSTSPRHEPVPSQHRREEKPGLLKLAEYDAPPVQSYLTMPLNSSRSWLTMFQTVTTIRPHFAWYFSPSVPTVLNFAIGKIQLEAQIVPINSASAP